MDDFLLQPTMNKHGYFVLFGLGFDVPDNSYGHVETVSSHNHIFFWASLTKRLTHTFAGN